MQILASGIVMDVWLPIIQTLVIALAFVATAWISHSRTAKISKIEARLYGLEVRLDGLETRLDGLESSVIRIETKIDNFISSLASGTTGR